MLDEADGGAEVVEEPAPAAVVEVDDPDLVAVQQQVGQPQVGVHQAEAMRSGAVAAQAGGQGGGQSTEHLALARADADAIAPLPPAGLRAESPVVVPGEPRERWRSLPALRVFMHAGGGGSQQAKGCGEALLGWLYALQELEHHGVAWLAARRLGK